MKNPHLNKTGVTLLEVMLSIGILAILAVLSVTSLYYPRYLVVTSAHEQSVIHAATSEIESYLYERTTPATRGAFNTDGWKLEDTNYTFSITPVTNDYSGDEYSYLIISNTVTCRDGTEVEFVTYRSLEVNKTLR